MKRWISYLTCIACALCSTIRADLTKEEPIKPPSRHIVINDPVDSVVVTDRTTAYVGRASADGTYAARPDNGKYIMAGVILVVAIAAIIYASRHHHNSHSH